MRSVSGHRERMIVITVIKVISATVCQRLNSNPEPRDVSPQVWQFSSLSTAWRQNGMISFIGFH